MQQPWIINTIIVQMFAMVCGIFAPIFLWLLAPQYLTFWMVFGMYVCTLYLILLTGGLVYTGWAKGDN